MRTKGLHLLTIGILLLLLIAGNGFGYAKVKIVFSDEAEQREGGGFKVFENLVKEFEKQNPGIDVEFQPLVGDYYNRLIAQAAAGTAPDVMVAYGDFGRVLIEKGQLLPLESYFTKEELSDFYTSQLEAFLVEGHLYEIPKYVSTIALAYNKDLFKGAGVAFPTEEWDWDDFLAAAQKLTKKDASGKYTQWGFHSQPWYYPYWVWQNGGEVMDKNFRGTKCLLNEPKALEALQWIHDLTWKYRVSPTSAEVEGKGIFETFALGNIAMGETHSWQLTDILTRAKFDWDVTFLPKGRTGKRASVIFADGYGVYKRTKHPKEAVRFLKFITSPEAEKVMATTVLSLQPSRKSVVPVWDKESAMAKAGKKAYIYSKTAEFARLDPYFINNAKVAELRSPIFEKVFFLNQMSVKDGVEELVRKIDQLFKNK